MAEGKLDLSDDIMSSRLSDQSRTSKVSVDASGGNDGDKLLFGYLDEPKDQSVSESIILLSPQWLYAKPSETKMGKYAFLWKEGDEISTASLGSDADVSEASFMDMLKKTAAPEPHSAGSIPEPTDGSQRGGGGKKKGKKGRQIDPALLGFKVTSNRIMMGEIQRAED